MYLGQGFYSSSAPSDNNTGTTSMMSDLMGQSFDIKWGFTALSSQRT